MLITDKVVKINITKVLSEPCSVTCINKFSKAGLWACNCLYVRSAFSSKLLMVEIDCKISFLNNKKTARNKWNYKNVY